MTTPRERFIELGVALPQCETVEAWPPHICLVVAGKRFAWYMDDHHGCGRLELNCRALPGVQQALIAENPRLYYFPKYVGSKGWAGVWLDEPDVDWEVVRDLLEQAYRLSAPKRLLKSIGWN